MKTGRFSILAVVLLLGLMDSSICIAAPFYPIEENGRWGYIDRKGRIIIKPQFDEAGDFSEGLAGVKMGARWGFVNSSGNVVIAPEFDQVERFKNSLARVRMGNLMAYLNKEGKVMSKAKQ